MAKLQAHAVKQITDIVNRYKDEETPLMIILEAIQTPLRRAFRMSLARTTSTPCSMRGACRPIASQTSCASAWAIRRARSAASCSATTT